MPASKKLIKNCLECMEELQKLLNSCHEWEPEKKKILKQIEDKVCSIKPNKNHWAVVQEEMNKLYQACPKNPNGSRGEAQHCHKCNVGWSWQTNGFGDFQWEGSYCEHSEPQNKEWLEKQGMIISKVGESVSQASNQAQTNTQSKQSNKSFTEERERESNSVSKTSYLPWILGGIGGLGLVGIAIYFLNKKKGDQE